MSNDRLQAKPPFYIKICKLIWLIGEIALSLHSQFYRGNSSVGRAQPCQGWGRGSESRFPLSLSLPCRNGGIGRHEGLKIPWPVMAVRVRVPLAALFLFNFSCMKKFAYILLLFATMMLASCGAGSGRFKFEGKFLNMNQGEFYVYSPEGGIRGMDTIKVEGGRFTYECDCKEPFTLIVVFPNFSEQPIFAESGASVDIKADASHLKELSVKGTKANELMNSFRENILSVSPPEEKAKAEQFVKDHPESLEVGAA